MKICCIIGGTGFIGSEVVRQLASKDIELVVIGRNNKPTRPLPDNVKYYQGDYGDKYFLEGVLSNVDEVIHLAYSTVPKTSFEDPVNDISTNLPATVKLLETALKFNISKLLLVSSGGTIYGKAGKLPIAEDHQFNPISPYGITKLVTEKYAMMYREMYGLPVVCVRPGNAYGEGQFPFKGQGFIATAIASILQNKEVAIFGEGGTIRDYIHVQDVAGGILAAFEKGIPGNCYNISSGVGRSNMDILNALRPYAEKMGLKINIKSCHARKFDVPANILDSTKITLQTGWKPVVSFEKGLERTWNWILENYIQ